MTALEGSDASLRLRWHAGFAEILDAGIPSISEASRPRSPQLDMAVADAITALSEVNVLLNGPVPSERIGVADDAIPRSLAYDVSEIVRMLRKQAHDDYSARAIEIAWNGILAGDIDDLREHVRLEQAARSQRNET